MSPMGTFVQFLYFQAMDLITTLAFLVHGVKEANPLVLAAMQAAPHPLLGLAAVKVAAVLLGIYCWRYRRKTLVRINILFALVVAWNVLAMVFALPGK